MKVSQFEIHRLAQRALEGLGAVYGVDRDGARATAWLEARGLPGLARLSQDLGGLENAFHPPRLRTGGGVDLVIDAGGRCALAFAGAAVDLSIGRTARFDDRPVSLRLERCRSPLFLLPLVSFASARGFNFTVAWQVPGSRFVGRFEDGGCLFHLSPGGELAAALLDDGPREVEILSTAGGNLPPAESGLAVVLDEGELARRFARSLDHGVAVDLATWGRIDKVAARVQVPASEESRLKGAGGGDANA